MASRQHPEVKMPNRRLDDDVAYVTGASSGIGFAVALELARAGAFVVLGARRQDRLRQAAERLRAEVAGARVFTHPLDVNDAASRAAWIAAAETAAGPCSIVVHNAGLALGRRAVADEDLREADTMLDTNVKSVIALSRALLPGMIARNRGDVVLIGSVAGSEPYALGAAYCASKAAVQAFGRALRAELLGRDVRVLTFDPGLVETEFSLVRFGGDRAAADKVYAGMRPLTAADVAECVAFALTRPRHVSLDRMLILATDQLGTQAVHRRPLPG